MCSGCEEIVYWEHVKQCERCPRYHCDRCLDSGTQVFTAEGCVDCESDKEDAQELAYLWWVIESYVPIEEAELRRRYKTRNDLPAQPPKEEEAAAAKVYMDESHPEFPERIKRIKEEIKKMEEGGGQTQ